MLACFGYKYRVSCCYYSPNDGIALVTTFFRFKCLNRGTKANVKDFKKYDYTYG